VEPFRRDAGTSTICPSEAAKTSSEEELCRNFARPRKARHITACNRIKIDRNKHDRNEGTRADNGLQCDFWTKGDNQLWVWPHKFHCIDEWTARLVQTAIVGGQVLLFGEAEVAQLSEERTV
jgi:hypothetical protein